MALAGERGGGDGGPARYEACHRAHLQRMKAMRRPVDEDFWPNPKDVSAELDVPHDGDSDGHADVD